MYGISALTVEERIFEFACDAIYASRSIDSLLKKYGLEFRKGKGKVDLEKARQLSFKKRRIKIMKDIILESRGGARLSEILPNYISKGVYSINGMDNKVSKPTCPNGYAQAVIVTPVGWSEKAQVDVSTLADNLKIT